MLGVVVGAAAGAYWYASTGGRPGAGTAGSRTSRSTTASRRPSARALRSAIQLVELPGAVGGDRWLYAVVAALVLSVAVGVAAARRARGARSSAASSRRLIAACAGAHTGCPAVCRRGVPRPVARSRPRRPRARGRSRHHTLRVERDLVRAAGRDPRSSRASSPSRVAVRRGALPTGRRPLRARAGLLARRALGRALLPGRRRTLPDGARSRSRGRPGASSARLRPVGLGPRRDRRRRASALAVLNDSKRPSGLPSSSGPRPRATGPTPRWQAQGAEVHVPDADPVRRRAGARRRDASRSRSPRATPGTCCPARTSTVGSSSSPAGRPMRRARPGPSSARWAARRSRLGCARAGGGSRRAGRLGGLPARGGC